MSEVLVSINCITYNQEEYIGETIESFLMQKTNFKYEIVIGDDCSTDNTRQIIDKYIKNNPNKIRLITSDENVGFMENFIRVKETSFGKYIAICEGDDYWTDEYKLQKQIDYMEKNPECTMSFHNAKRVDAISGINQGSMIDNKLCNDKYYLNNVLDLKFIPTASVVYRKYTMDNLPVWFNECIVFDLPTSLLTTSYGYAYYIRDNMSIYRVGNPKSLMGKWGKEKKILEGKVGRIRRFIDIFNNLNKFTEYRYDKYLIEEILSAEFKILILTGDLKKIKDEKYRKLYKKLGYKGRIKVYILRYAPRLCERLFHFKNYLNNSINTLKNKNI